MMLVPGFIVQRVRTGRAPKIRASGGARRDGGLIRDPVLWLCTSGAAADMAAYGVRFAAEIGEQPASGAVGLRIIGLVGGFIVGALLHTLRRLR